jgi:hypothetical protein
LEKNGRKNPPVFCEKENWPFFFFGDLIFCSITLAHEKPPVTKSGANRCFYDCLFGFLGGLDHFIFVFVAFQEFNLANILV